MTGTCDSAFMTLTERVSRRSGIAVAGYKDKCLKRRIAVRMRACGVHSYADYLAVLDRDPGEYDRLTDSLTINVTRFYRNPEMWNLLRSAILPDLLSSRLGRLRVWSAGCASGEEAHTLLMVLADAAAQAGHPEWMDVIGVDATDIDRVSLERARAGRYPMGAVTDLPPDLMHRYGRHEGGEFVVDDGLRRRLAVRRLDLSAVPPRPAYDLIFCRNVAIYFDRPSQARLFQLLAEVLTSGGVLVLGRVEALSGPARDRLVLVDARQRIYRRPA